MGSIHSLHPLCSMSQQEGYEEGYEEGYDAQGGQSGQALEGKPHVALYDYQGSNEGELTFKVGDILYVLSEVKEGWYSAVFNGYTGYAPSNYLQAEENPEEIAAAKRARREKMIAERNELRANVKQKRDLRKQLEDEVNTLEESNRERKALLKKLANPTDNVDFVTNDLATLSMLLALADRDQAHFAELSTSLMMGLSSLTPQLDIFIQPGNPLEEPKKKLSEEISSTIKTYSLSGEKLADLIRARKEFSPLLEEIRSQLTQE